MVFRREKAWSISSPDKAVDTYQLICFRKHTYPVPDDIIEFNGVHLNFSEIILHLHHLISFDLSDQKDIFRIIKSINWKANLIMNTFRFSDPFVLTYLFKTYCLSLYGSNLWSLSSNTLKHLQVSINKILRKIWNLPPNSHTSIVLETAGLSFLSNMIINRFEKFIFVCMESGNPIVKLITCDSVCLAYSSIGYNFMYNQLHLNHFSDHDSHYFEYDMILQTCIWHQFSF